MSDSCVMRPRPLTRCCPRSPPTPSWSLGEQPGRRGAGRREEGGGGGGGGDTSQYTCMHGLRQVRRGGGGGILGLQQE